MEGGDGNITGGLATVKGTDIEVYIEKRAVW